MFQYFVRRLLLAIPTFIGCTMVVFFIVQFAPGGAYEMQLNALKKGGAGGEGGGATAMGAEASNIPPTQLEALQRYYQVDRPIWERYLIWMAILPNKVDDYQAQIGKPRNVGKDRRVYVRKGPDGQLAVYDAADTTKRLEEWHWDPSKTEGAVWVYRTQPSGLLTLDFGTSYQYRKPVSTLISERMHVSIQFGLIGFILSYVVCFYLGTQKALRHGSAFDVATSSGVFIAYSIPGWAVGAVLLVLLGGGSFLAVFPTGGFQSNNYDTFTFFEKVLDRAWFFILPTIAYTIGGFASLTMLMKNSLLDTMGQDYIRTAYAKGLRENRVIWMHAMRNSIIPLVATIGNVIAIFLASNYLIEVAFNIEGIGKLSFDAVVYRDVNVFFAFTVISVIVTLLGSIISDFMLAVVDPRIRFK